MNNYGFPRHLRLLNPEDFRRVFALSKYKAFCPGFLLLAMPNQLNKPRLGFVFSKKNLKKAVDRNKFKRMFREAFRLQTSLPNIDIIVLATKSAQQAIPSEVAEKIPMAWQHLNKKATLATPTSNFNNRQ